MPLYEDISPFFETGDLLLFHGPGPLSRFIEDCENAPISHAATIIRLPNHDRPLLWTSDELKDIVDVLDGKKHEGVHLLDLQAVLNITSSRKFHDGQHYTYFWRKLNCDRNEAFMQSLDAFMKSVDDDAFPSLFNMFFHFAEGRLGIATQSKSFFCSELVTATYKSVGLLPADLLKNSLSPGDYYTGHGVDLQNGATLNAPIEVAYHVAKPSSTTKAP